MADAVDLSSVCGLGTILQVSRIPLGKGYYLGSGVINSIGTSFAFVSSALTFINNQYNRDGGLCSLAADGSKLPCPEAYGAVIGTASVVGPIAVLLSFTPSKVLRKVSAFFLSLLLAAHVSFPRFFRSSRRSSPAPSFS